MASIITCPQHCWHDLREIPHPPATTAPIPLQCCLCGQTAAQDIGTAEIALGGFEPVPLHMQYCDVVRKV